ncbi:hypothetical protein GUJ93_ZPchr0008g11479 [Zizania palustris]|uniref:Uncharacterized protein n=1 Tax=Zizania palustris TaxID=103762 RepID=A0A8J5QXN2_ZIZPA|nr:hypothetical protein GUJ93_ZPchr0008g11479 [Zizania palustris]
MAQQAAENVPELQDPKIRPGEARPPRPRAPETTTARPVKRHRRAAALKEFFAEGQCFAGRANHLSRVILK